MTADTAHGGGLAGVLVAPGDVDRVAAACVDHKGDVRPGPDRFRVPDPEGVVLLREGHAVEQRTRMVVGAVFAPLLPGDWLHLAVAARMPQKPGAVAVEPPSQQDAAPAGG